MNKMSKAKKKKTEENEDSQPTREDLMIELSNAQTIVNQLVGQVNAYKSLCVHYEQTINVMTGRLLEYTKGNNQE
jgi:hypothetical protein|tara:strand:- start:367 stop:591 length:225 start_codon:yes stop_codon:yes gene_type:complete